MSESSNTKVPVILFRRLLLAAAILVFLAIVTGGMVRATGSSHAIVDTLHRFVTLLALPAVLSVTGLAWRFYRQDRRIRIPINVAMGLLLVQVLLGGLVALQPGRSAVTAVHLGLSLLIQAALLIPLVIVFFVDVDIKGELSSQTKPGLPYRTPFARLSLVTLAAVFVLLVSGALVSASGAGSACPAWPLCSSQLWPGSPAAWVAMIHRSIVAATAILVLALLVQAWRTQRSQPAILVASTAAGVLFFAQALMGGYKVLQGFPLYMVSIHEATAAAVWAALIVQVVAVGMAGRTVADECQDLASIAGRKGLGRDLLMLTKPIVVVLLLVTTYTGMVIGARSWPSLGLVFWTLLGGALAAGGSGAINQYIDRFDDLRMQRTEKRPIPAGRLTPGEGLAFGVALTLASFYLTLAFVNLLAALLVLAGIIYYVLIYSIFLKKATIQNIVIGGGAGAIPPLVGWAAATGGLNIPSLFLFAVVFMWTPPHFWALAIVRRSDYARAGVPMLPVVRGEKSARWQIFLYTIELVALTLLLPLFGLGSSLYLISAAALGGWLLYSAWKLWRQGGNKVAWKMYRYSSMYLAFLFVALMVDRLIF